MFDAVVRALTGASAILDSPIVVAATLAVLVFVTVLLLVVALASPAESAVQQRLRAYGYNLASQSTGDLREPFVRRVGVPLGRALGGLLRRLTPEGVVEGTRRRLREASSPIGLTTLLALRLVVMILLPAVCMVPTLTSGRPWRPLDWAVAAFLVYAGNRLPDIWLSFQIDARRAEITRSLPDALDLIVVCVEAGYGLEAAIAKVVESTKGPLSQEFGQMLAEISVGRPRRDALRALSERCGSSDLQTFISSILQADQMGVAVAEALRLQADSIRIRRRQRAEEAIAKAPVKMLLPLTLFIFPALLVVIGGPAALRIMQMFANMR